MLCLEILHFLIPRDIVAVSVAALRVQIDLYIGIHLVELLRHGIDHGHIAAGQIFFLVSVPMSHIGMIDAVSRPCHNVDLAADLRIHRHIEGSGVHFPAAVVRLAAALLSAALLSAALLLGLPAAGRLAAFILAAACQQAGDHGRRKQQS